MELTIILFFFFFFKLYIKKSYALIDLLLECRQFMEFFFLISCTNESQFKVFNGMYFPQAMKIETHEIKWNHCVCVNIIREFLQYFLSSDCLNHGFLDNFNSETSIWNLTVKTSSKQIQKIILVQRWL